MESAKNDHNYYAGMAQSLPEAVGMVEIKMEEVDLDAEYDYEYSGQNYYPEQGGEAPNEPHGPSVPVEVVCEPICFPENFQIKTEEVDLDTEYGDEPSADDLKKEESAEIGVVQRRISQRIRKKAKSSPYVCNECGKCYKYESCLMKHQQYHVSGLSHETDKIPSQSINCSECGKQYKFPSDLKRHMRTHALAILKRAMALTSEETEDSPKPEQPPKPVKPGKEKPDSSGNFVCDICSASFDKRKYLRYHKTIHTDEGKQKDSKRFYCEVCNFSFSKNKNMLRHMKNHPGFVPSTTTRRVLFHSTRGEYKCNFCDKCFIYEIFLLKHMKKHHGHDAISKKKKNAISKDPDLSLFLCSDCGKIFSSPSDLRRHGRIHTGLRPFSCEFCPASFAQNGHLIVHRRIHTDEKNFHCDLCTMSFSTKSNLALHITRHMRKLGAAEQFLCTRCGKSFGSNCDLRRHARTVHWGIRSFLCSECGSAFTQNGHLRMHLKRHLQVGLEFKCPQCPKYFVCKKALSVHSGTHANEVRDVEGEVGTYVLIKGRRDEVLESCPSSERKLANSDV